MQSENIIIFCDGACRGNPGPGGWGVVVATPQGEVWELGGFAPSTTNNQMELTAAREALQSVAHLKDKVILYTDSTYVIRGITQWIHGWKKKAWKTAEGNDVLNRKLWEQLLSLVVARDKQNSVTWKYVRGHQGIPGNERADKIAVAFSRSEEIYLYHGPLLQYPISFYDLPKATHLPGSKSKEKGKPYSYLSLLGGIPARHSSWEQCKSRIHGVSGAKFKKAMSVKEEEEILRSWGLTQL